MVKVLISSRLARQIYGINKFAATDDWRERVVTHITPTGLRSKTKIKFLPPEEQDKYRPAARSKSGFMPLNDIQQELSNYQKTGSATSFKKLFVNFTPMIARTVNEVIGERNASHEDRHDLLQAANLIFVKALSNADTTNPGLINYLKSTLTKQLEGKSREIFRSTVKVNPKDRRLLRAVQRAFHAFEKEHGYTPTPEEYDTIARKLNEDPTGKINHATPELIAELLQTGDVSLESEVGGEKEDARQRHELIGPENVSDDTLPDDEAYSPKRLFYPSPEENAITSNIRSIVEKAIDTLDDPLQRKSIRLFNGFGVAGLPGDDTHEGEELGHAEIAEILGVPRRDVRRAIERAQIKLKNMSDVRKLSDIYKQSSSMMKIINACSKHVKFVYVPNKIEKVGSSYFIDDVVVTKYANQQLICSCGKNCLHKDVVRSILAKGM